MSGADRGPAEHAAVERMRVREDVLQICYWYQGEGFGDRFTPDAVLPFLQSGRALVVEVFDRLVDDGSLAAEASAYVFREHGRREAARLFADSFTEFQQAGHGECAAGCCDEEGDCDDPAHGHGHGAHPGHGHGGHG